MLTRGAPRAQPIELNILGCDSMPRSERSDGSPHALGGSRTLHRACEPITTTPVDGHAELRKLSGIPWRGAQLQSLTRSPWLALSAKTRASTDGACGC